MGEPWPTKRTGIILAEFVTFCTSIWSFWLMILKILMLFEVVKEFAPDMHVNNYFDC